MDADHMAVMKLARLERHAASRSLTCRRRICARESTAADQRADRAHVCAARRAGRPTRLPPKSRRSSSNHEPIARSAPGHTDGSVWFRKSTSSRPAMVRTTAYRGLTARRRIASRRARFSLQPRRRHRRAGSISRAARASFLTRPHQQSVDVVDIEIWRPSSAIMAAAARPAGHSRRSRR